MAEYKEPTMIPSEWERHLGIKIVDPDGWRMEGRPGSGKIVEAVGWNTPISEEEFRNRATMSTTRAVPARPRLTTEMLDRDHVLNHWSAMDLEVASPGLRSALAAHDSDHPTVYLTHPVNAKLDVEWSVCSACSATLWKRPKEGAEKPAERPTGPLHSVPPTGAWPDTLRSLTTLLRRTLRGKEGVAEHLPLIEEYMFNAWEKAYLQGREEERDNAEIPNWMRYFRATLGQSVNMFVTGDGNPLLVEYHCNVPTWAGPNLKLVHEGLEIGTHVYGYDITDGLLIVRSRMELDGAEVELKP